MARPKNDKPSNADKAQKKAKKKKPALGKKKRKPVTKKHIGRPIIYDPDYHDEKAYRLSLLGLRKVELAEAMDIHEDTIYDWQKKYPSFSEAMKRGGVSADGEIAEALFKRAKGYSHPEDKYFQYEGQIITVRTTKHYPPDTGAAYIWIKNRKPKQWGENKPEDEKPLRQIILVRGPETTPPESAPQ